jgi:RNA polymerase sigma-70 factor (ECF subfamily)
VAAFAAAWQAGDVDGLLEVLDPEVVFTSDGGGRVNAARRPLHGAERVTRALLGFARAQRTRDHESRAALERVNGLPGLVIDDGETLNVFSCTVDAGRIVAIDVVRNPDKLAHVAPPTTEPAAAHDPDERARPVVSPTPQPSPAHEPDA